MIYVFSFLLILLGAELNQIGATINTVHFWIIIIIVISIMFVLEIWADQEIRRNQEKDEQ